MRFYGQSTDGMTYESTANLVFSQSTKCRQQANSSTPYRLNSHRTYPHYIPLQPALQGFLVFIACLFWTKLRLGECRGKVFFYYAEPKQVRRRQQQPMCYVSSVAVFMIEQHYILSCYGFFRCEVGDTWLSTRTGGVYTKISTRSGSILQFITFLFDINP